MTSSAATPSVAESASMAIIRNPALGGPARVVGRSNTSAAGMVASALARLGATPEMPIAAPPSVDPRVEREEELRAVRAAAFEEGRLAGLREQRQAVFEDGMRQGVAEGRAAGEMESQRRLASLHDQAMERLRRIDEIGAALSVQWREQLAARLASVEDDMVGLCHAVICRFLGHALASRSGVAQLMRTAIEQWLQASEKQSRDGPTVVRVHAVDLEAMKSDEMLARWLVQQGVRGLQWQAGDDISLGGCVIQGTEGDLDARLETQFQNLHEELLRGRSHRDPDSPAPTKP